MTRLRDYLVFETIVVGGSGAPDSHYAAMGTAPPAQMARYECVGAVRAPDAQAAATAVMAHTRRISKFAVIEAEIIDFQPGAYTQAEGTRVELNP